MRPERSGTPSPESMRPSAKGSGGKVTGMRMTVAGRAASSVQKTGPRRLFSHGGPRRREARREPRGTPRAAAPSRARPPERLRRARRRRSEQESAGAGRSPRPTAARTAGVFFPRRNGTARLLRDREGRDPVGGIPLQEVEDLVAARDRGPSRTSPRTRGSAPGPCGVSGEYPPRRRSSAEVRQLSPGQHLLDDLRVHAVEARGSRRDPERWPRAAPRGGATG